MEETSLNLAMHGFGMIGRVHWLALQTAAMSPGMWPNVNATHCVVRDLNSESAQKARQVFQHVHDSMEDLPFATLDAIDIASSNDVHRQVADAAIEHGVHVYCEKPLASHLEDARAMAARAKTRPDLFHQVALLYRFHPAVEQAYTVLQSGVLGKVLTFRAELLHGSYLNPDRPMSWRLTRSISGGGATLDLGVHMIDLVHFLIGRTAAQHSQVKTFIPFRKAEHGAMEPVTVDDWASLQLTLESGAVGSVEVSRIHYGREVDRLEIICQFGSIRMNLHEDGPAVIKTLPGHHTDPQGTYPLDDFRIPVKYSGDVFLRSHATSLLTFLHRVRGGRINYPVPTFDDALAAEEVVHQAFADPL